MLTTMVAQLSLPYDTVNENMSSVIFRKKYSKVREGTKITVKS